MFVSCLVSLHIPAYIEIPAHQTYANTSYPSVDTIKFVVSAMHRGQHNYDNPKINVRILISAYSGQFLHSRVIRGLEKFANSIIRE